MAPKQQKPILPTSPTVDDAKRHLRSLVRWVGPGFHPDTDFHDYVLTDTGERSYEPSAADALNADLNSAVRILEAAGIDPCAVAMPVQRRLLLAICVR